MNTNQSTTDILRHAASLGAVSGSQRLCSRSHRAHHLNSDGAFYVEDEICLVCDLPHDVAPELIDYEIKDGHPNHCFFKRQPNTEDELLRASEIVHLSCCNGLRYCGTDLDIIKKIVEAWPDSYSQIDLLSKENS